jgi:DNA-binding NarL/FixJ family response regulator
MTLKVVIADDDAVARAMIEAALEQDEAIELVGSAEDALGAVALTLEHQPDVVVLDWVMPGGGGSQAAREILLDNPAARIVALTASDTEEASLDMLRAGAKSFLVKGAPPSELSRTIHGAMAL